MYISAGYYIDSLLEFENEELSDLEDELHENGNVILLIAQKLSCTDYRLVTDAARV